MIETSVSIAGFAASTSLGYSLESTLAAMGTGLTNFTESGVPNEFGHATMTASLVEANAPRGERLAMLLRHGLDDARSILTDDGVGALPLLIGAPSDLGADERELAGTVLREYSSFVGDARWLPQGRASTFAALTTAKRLVGSGARRFVLVGGIDSLCAPAQVYSLVQAGRVLSPLTEGMIPGEAAAFALLARTDDPIIDPATAVRLESVALERATPFLQARVVSAEALAAVFRALRKGGSRRVQRVIGAHSGEGYFGRSFAHAYLRELEVMPEPLDVELIADRVGDVGAAAGILGLAFGVYLMVEDGRDDGGRALVYSESDTGEVGAAIVDGTPRSWHRQAILQRLTQRG
jgi:3-oxoacyl-[acyl-carrier-protein] synthase I